MGWRAHRLAPHGAEGGPHVEVRQRPQLLRRLAHRRGQQVRCGGRRQAQQPVRGQWPGAVCGRSAPPNYLGANATTLAQAFSVWGPAAEAGAVRARAGNNQSFGAVWWG